jgi:hypothetical protein
MAGSAFYLPNGEELHFKVVSVQAAIFGIRLDVAIGGEL